MQGIVRVAVVVLASALQLLSLQPVLAASSDTALHGEAALSHLQASGKYQSLSSAYDTARHAIHPVESAKNGELWGQTPRHGLRSEFSNEGLRLIVDTPDSKQFKSQMRLVSVGYGDGQHAIGKGELSSQGNRVSIKREWIDEWFINKPTGLEQGFTLSNRPPRSKDADATEQLKLTLELDGDLTPRAAANGQAVSLHSQSGELVLQYDGLKAWDANGKSVASTLSTRGQKIVFTADDRGVAYPLTIDPTYRLEAPLSTETAGPGTFFGRSLSLSGNTVVAGGRENVAYIFVNDAVSGQWIEEARLTASLGDSDDSFGIKVSISGDTVVVGATEEDSGSTGVNGDETDNSLSAAGAAYVFVRNSGNWSQQAYLKASNPGEFDRFGRSVSIDGETVVVGAPGESGVVNDIGGPFQAGAAYVFTRTGGIWSQQAYLKASNAQPYDFFGERVDIDGDTIAVGARGEESNLRFGAVYVFTKLAGNWGEQGIIKSPDPNLSSTTSCDHFGHEMVLDEDTLVVADGCEKAIEVFTRSLGIWSHEVGIITPTVEQSIALDEDTLVVGSWENSVVPNVVGVFRRTSGNWVSQAELRKPDHPNMHSGRHFGIGVAVEDEKVMVAMNWGIRIPGHLRHGWVFPYTEVPGYPTVECGNINGANHTFNFHNYGWDSLDHYLHIGSTSGADDIYISNNLPANVTSHEVTGLPTDGSEIYLTLHSLINGVVPLPPGVEYVSEETVCTTASFSEPTIYAPLPGSTITGDETSSGTTETIKWKNNGTPVTNFWLYAGSSIGGRQIHNSGDLGTGTSEEVIGIPSNGRKVYVRLWYSLDNGTNWNYTDIEYRSRNNDNGPYLTDPAPGVALGDGLDAVWTDNGPNDPSDKYRIYAGPNYGSSAWTQTTNLPHDQRSYPISGWSAADYGRTVWVRFLWRKNGQWKRSNHSYVAGYGPAAIAVEETRPVPPGQ